MVFPSSAAITIRYSDPSWLFINDQKLGMEVSHVVISATNTAKLLVHTVIHRNCGERNRHQLGKEKSWLIGEK
jgi:hypothetical protein